MKAGVDELIASYSVPSFFVFYISRVLAYLGIVNGRKNGVFVAYGFLALSGIHAPFLSFFYLIIGGPAALFLLGLFVASVVRKKSQEIWLGSANILVQSLIWVYVKLHGEVIWGIYGD